MKKYKIDMPYIEEDELVVLRFGKYQDGSVAIQGFTDLGEALFTATVCIDTPAKPNHVWLKSWGENEGLPEALEKARILMRTGLTRKCGYAYAEEAILLITPE